MSTSQIPAIKLAMFTYFTDVADVAPELLTDGSVLVENLGIDSLSLIEMLWDVEEKFGVHIDDVAALKGMSVDQIAEYISRQLPADLPAAAAAALAAPAV